MMNFCSLMVAFDHVANRDQAEQFAFIAEYRQVAEAVFGHQRHALADGVFQGDISGATLLVMTSLTGVSLEFLLASAILRA